jgi:Na+/H+ antiporter NhaA
VLHESVSVAERLEHTLHPWTSYVVIPVFALANAGVVLTSDGIADAATSTVTLGVVLGLVAGKLVGVTAAAWLATRLGVADLPTGVRWGQVVGIAAIAGIGFTVSLFVGALAFDDAVLRDQATIGVLVASALAAAIGTVLLRRGCPAPADDGQAEAELARSGS